MKKPNIWIFCLEPIDSRYTQQWYTNIPKILSEAAHDKFNVRQIDGLQKASLVTKGAFLNFSDTNYWKSSQLCKFLECFDNNETTPEDRFLFTDAWNPAILQIKYMRDLLDQKWQLHGIWHAGAYDPSDILGYKMEKPWPWEAEKAMFYSCDYNYYATNFHLNMFLHNLDIKPEHHARAVRSGQPHTPIIEQCINAKTHKENILMWPHRYNADKQPEIIEDLQKHIKASTVITQKLSLTKDEYYSKLGQSKVMFSCSLHENLGISLMEGVLAGVIPVVPNRCSYREMYLDCFLYPSVWTKDYNSYITHKADLVEFINDKIVNYDGYRQLLEKQKEILIENYLTPTIMINKLIN
jgi:hypothetical protein